MTRNEAETRKEIIDKKLEQSQWITGENIKVYCEFPITNGRIELDGNRGSKYIADYVLEYKGVKLATIEAKKESLSVTEGVMQAKDNSKLLDTPYAYSTNGNEIYEIFMQTGNSEDGYEAKQDSKERKVDKFPTPDELFDRIYSNKESYTNKFASEVFKNLPNKTIRYYQEVAVKKTLDKIAKGEKRLLLNLATGTGKTDISFHLVWKLYKTKWNLKNPSQRTPRILFLVDRNLLADQAYNRFSAFPDGARIRVNTDLIRKKGEVPTNASIFFSIFQTLVGKNGEETNYKSYPNDFFDLVIIDECHRGGAKDESNWRNILEYFESAVQIGMTATPKRKENVDTYNYFGKPVYTYSLKEGIQDGFLTPFKVKRIQTTMDDYTYVKDDFVLEGEVKEGQTFTTSDFNRKIIIPEKEENNIKILLSNINPDEKAIIFCADQDHAALIRDIVNQQANKKDPNYCVRVTSSDGEQGENYLRMFQDNEQTIPTILTTSQKLSTGVDALNIRNIVLMRTVNSMIEFKQIIGRGTRLYDNKYFFTIIDFVGASEHFKDTEWDGEPILETSEKKEKEKNIDIDLKVNLHNETEVKNTSVKIKIKLAHGKDIQIQHMISTHFYIDTRLVSAGEYVQHLYNGMVPKLFENEEELRKIWSDRETRGHLLEALEKIGIGENDVEAIRTLISAKDSDVYDLIRYIAFAKKPLTRSDRIEKTKKMIFKNLNEQEKEFISFFLERYEAEGHS